jgi:hypothetical protein
MVDPTTDDDEVGHYTESLTTRYCENCGWPTPRRDLRRDGFRNTLVCGRRGCWSPDEPPNRPIPASEGREP